MGFRTPFSLACVAVALAACSGGHSSSTGTPPSTGSPSVATSTPPGPTPGPTVTSVAGVKAPVTPKQLASVFGQSLPGPYRATNGQPTLLYGDVHSDTHLVVSVSIYTPSVLKQRGFTPEEYYSQGEDPTAEHVTGIGKKAYLVQDVITVLTAHDDVLIVAANQQVDESQLESAAKAAAAKL